MSLFSSDSSLFNSDFSSPHWEGFIHRQPTLFAHLTLTCKEQRPDSLPIRQWTLTVDCDHHFLLSLILRSEEDKKALQAHLATSHRPLGPRFSHWNSLQFSFTQMEDLLNISQWIQEKAPFPSSIGQAITPFLPPSPPSPQPLQLVPPIQYTLPYSGFRGGSFRLQSQTAAPSTLSHSPFHTFTYSNLDPEADIRHVKLHRFPSEKKGETPSWTLSLILREKEFLTYLKKEELIPSQSTRAQEELTLDFEKKEVKQKIIQLLQDFCSFPEEAVIRLQEHGGISPSLRRSLKPAV